MADLSRRALVAALPVVAVPGVTLPAVAPDPIFAAVAAQQITWNAFGDAVEAADTVLARQQGRTVTIAQELAKDAANAADNAAIDRLSVTAPTTWAGLIAGLHVVNDRGDDMQIMRMVETILASPLAGSVSQS